MTLSLSDHVTEALRRVNPHQSGQTTRIGRDRDRHDQDLERQARPRAVAEAVAALPRIRVFSQRPQLLPPAAAPLATALAFGLWAAWSVVGFGQGVPSGYHHPHPGRMKEAHMTRNRQAISSLARLGAAPGLGVALVLGVALATGIGASGASAQTTLRVANSGEPDSLDPHQVSGNWEDRIIGDMFMGLTTEAADGTRDPGRRRELDDQRRRPDLHLHAARPHLVGRHAGHRRRLRVRPAPDPRSRDRGRVRLPALPDQERRGASTTAASPIPRRSARARSTPRPSRSRSSSRPPTSSSC